MGCVWRIVLAVIANSIAIVDFGFCEDEFAVRLPEGIQAVWDTAQAQREATETRERICINGLWRWQPVRDQPEHVPSSSWGFFKVPGCWPGITDYMQKDCQAVYSHPRWQDKRLADVTSAWYQRDIFIPESWTGKRVTLAVECLNSHAVVYMDGKRVGELRFPGGELEITEACLLRRMGVNYELIEATADVSPHGMLIVGKLSLTTDSPAPNITRVREGLRVLLFEQSSEVLEKRFGFRVQEYGLRWVFPRLPSHPILAGVKSEHLRDWRGSATLLSPQLKYEMRPRHGPTVQWCDIPVSRLWRCGNRGNVASVLIEKPACGDFRPIVDGGYSLQYSPLLEYREGKGVVLFCQMDVTGRSEPDPSAETLALNALRYLSDWKPTTSQTALYVGDPAGNEHLKSTGITVQPYEKRWQEGLYLDPPEEWDDPYRFFRW